MGVVTEAREGEVREWRKGSLRRGTGSVSLRLSCRFVVAEQNAAGWPPWLTFVAREAIQGWVSLITDSFERLDKNFFLTYTSQSKAATDSTTYLIGHKNLILNRSFQVLFIN
ncbi:Protein IMPAIRED IN BABA-INDUCED STERILITY 1 [Glycine soja]